MLSPKTPFRTLLSHTKVSLSLGTLININSNNMFFAENS